MSRRDIVAMLRSPLEVLVADDITHVRTTLVMMLAEINTSWLVDEASSAEQALELAKRYRYDLILLDENFGLAGNGRLTGTQATVQLREAGNAKTLIVGLTGDECAAHTARALESGQDAVIGKPFHDSAAFLGLLRELIADSVDHRFTTSEQ
jgi:CheY-like chemotaxis protein